MCEGTLKNTVQPPPPPYHLNFESLDSSLPHPKASSILASSHNYYAICTDVVHMHSIQSHVPESIERLRVT